MKQVQTLKQKKNSHTKETDGAGRQLIRDPYKNNQNQRSGKMYKRSMDRKKKHYNSTSTHAPTRPTKKNQTQDEIN